MNVPTILKKIKSTIFSKDFSGTRIVFIHVPKCGGRSLEDAVKKALRTQNSTREYVRIDSKRAAKMSSLLYNTNYTHGDVNDYHILNFSQEYLTYSLAHKNLRFISGHCSFNNKTYEAYKNDFKYVTILRDPVKKWISNFNFRKYRESDHWKIEEDIYQYLKTDRGKYHGYDYSKYYGGARSDNNYYAREIIEKAKDNLHLFSVVGILENLNDVENKFKSTLNTPIKIEKINVTKKANGHKYDSQVIKLIEDICSTDIEIYNYAVKNFVNQQKK